MRAALPPTSGSTVGIIANPMSGRDIRRLVAQASVFPNAEKTNMALRIVAACAATGVSRVLLSTDAMGVAGGVARARERGTTVPHGIDLEFVELEEMSGTAADTRAHVAAMRARGAQVIVLLGGDGTIRAAAAAAGDTVLLPLSTGTNNAFPEMWEATVAGTAAGLVATNRLDADRLGYRAKALHVRAGAQEEIALVDVCVSTESHVGSRALWRTDSLRELFCAFADPHAVGLSSIAGLMLPKSRHDPDGVHLTLGGGRPDGSSPTTWSVLAPIAPGVVTGVAVDTARTLEPGEISRVSLDRGTVAVDGEREIEFGPSTRVTVRLAHDGPRVLDVRATLAAAAAQGLLIERRISIDTDREIS
ncbi:NAD(+)/NADH kinase [Pseudonocardia sp. RS11V-5]|uniref:ATP-NAD kinase family protein n=1 Tax=Pseudonocardia terrae TaxID=2905831 RepID=UPI001E3AAA8F|nr:NAD(+)/NADH kinase [Pseudonocardia terrae]MCE3550214.1 NAD(+)/NADH kinase [Pseudonocardia terrae]